MVGRPLNRDLPLQPITLGTHFDFVPSLDATNAQDNQNKRAQNLKSSHSQPEGFLETGLDAATQAHTSLLFHINAVSMTRNSPVNHQQMRLFANEPFK